MNPRRPTPAPPGIALAALLVLLTGCSAGADHCTMARATTLDLHAGSGHAYTRVVLNGIEANMIVDTGASDTVVTRAMADRLKLHLDSAGEASGIGGSIESFEFYAKTFQIGTLRGKDLPLLVGDIQFPIGPEMADGLLGADFLAAYDVDLDLPAHQARLFKVVAGCTAPAAVLDPPLFYARLVPRLTPTEFRPIVSVQIAGHTLLALIDSGAPHSAIFRNAADRLGLHLEDLKADLHDVTGGIGPKEVKMVRHVVPPITIGEITVANLPVAILDQSADDSVGILLGMDFLRRVHTWFSFSSSHLIMQFPPKPSPPDQSGA